jgi:hypothetical protein
LFVSFIDLLKTLLLVHVGRRREVKVGDRRSASGTDSEAKSDSLVPLTEDGVVAPVAGLLTVFVRSRFFRGGDFRRLLQVVTATLLYPKSAGMQAMEAERDRLLVDAESCAGDDERSQLMAKAGAVEQSWFDVHYHVHPHALAERLRLWRAKGWLEVGADGRHRLTALGAVALMTAISACHDGVQQHRLALLLLSLYAMQTFPFEQLATRVPGLKREIRRRGPDVVLGRRRVPPLELNMWDWRRCCLGYEQHFERLHRELVVESRALAEAGDVLSAQGARDRPQRVTARGMQARDDDQAFADFYFPGLFPFRRQRSAERGPMRELGSEPLQRFLGQFDEDWQHSYLTHGVAAMARLQQTQADHLGLIAEALKSFRKGAF